MAAASSSCSNPSLCRNYFVVSSPTRSPFCSFFRQSSFVNSRIPTKWLSLTDKTRPNRRDPLTFSGPKLTCSSSYHTFDVVIIGAGIIGLTIARQFLLGSDLSVAVVDKAVPCSGATGAGQGYLWMAHKTPGSDIWDLAVRSHELWRMFAESLRDQGMDPQDHLGWKNTGSLLIGRTPEEVDVLKGRVKHLNDAGVRSEYLSGSDLLSKEPALMVDNDWGAAYQPDDCQLDAHRAVDVILKANRNFSAQGRYTEFFHHPVASLLRSAGSGKVVGVKTAKNMLCGKVIVVAAGCWSGSLMQDLFIESDIELNVPVKPRKGHLLVLKNFSSLQLNHALMEVGYVAHQTVTQPPSSSTSEVSNHGQNLSISMTATIDTLGNLVLGSSREFAGFSTEMDESVINRIWGRATDFFPKLKEHSLSDLIKRREVRVGLRPYMPDGKPMIGPVTGSSNVMLATGHEGSGLSMALGTAEMVADLVLGNPEKVNYAPFAVHGR